MMRVRDLVWRLSGAVCLAGTLGACLWLRATMDTSLDQASPLRASLIFACFALTIFGLRLLLGGSRQPGDAAPRREALLGETVVPDPFVCLAFMDGRTSQAELLTRRVIGSAARRASDAATESTGS